MGEVFGIFQWGLWLGSIPGVLAILLGGIVCGVTRGKASKEVEPKVTPYTSSLPTSKTIVMSAEPSKILKQLKALRAVGITDKESLTQVVRRTAAQEGITLTNEMIEQLLSRACS